MMSNKFNYLINKINVSSKVDSPFELLEINNFLSDNDFKEIISAEEINIPSQDSDEDLLNYFFNNGYKCINFPGSITSKSAYLKWHKNKNNTHDYTNTSCEGFGMTFRLKEPKSPIIEELMKFLSSLEFQEALAKKFNIDLDKVNYDQGIQKYLDGYEISPHPDLREKALTFMVNINPSDSSESKEHHTHYMKFKDEYKYVQTFWEGNKDKNRCWVPWNWCETVKEQSKNNSIVVFSPNNKSLHAVKANYNHLSYQRTQLYGNLWYNDDVPEIKAITSNPIWEEFVVKKSSQIADRSLRKGFSRLSSGVFKDTVIKVIGKKLYDKIKYY